MIIIGQGTLTVCRIKRFRRNGGKFEQVGGKSDRAERCGGGSLSNDGGKGQLFWWKS